jgi:predicted hydrocarbon binding protein
MPPTSSRQQEIAIPVAALVALRESLTDTVGADSAAEALRAAGYAAGDAFFRILAADDKTEPSATPADLFWSRLMQLFVARGWGQLSYEAVHPGVGALTAKQWAESRSDITSHQPCCHITTGLLANLLGSVAGSEVAVLEVECRGRGDDCCRFLFGGAEAVYALYERISAGEQPDEALASIG